MDPHTGSFNHYSYGAVCDFLFSRTVGIRPVIEKPGYQEFIVEPVTGESFTEAKAVYESLYGTISSEWTQNGGLTEYQIEVPVNTIANVRLNGSIKDLEKIQNTYRE